MIPEQRKFHLSFCKICINRKLNFENGLTCGLTNQVASFENNCSVYQCDTKEVQKLKNRFDKYIKEEFPKSGLKGALAEIEFNKIPKALHEKFPTPKSTHGFKIKKDNKYDISIIGMLWILTGILAWGNFRNDFPWDLSSLNVIGMIVMFFGSFYFIYKGYFYDYPTLITIQEKGIDNQGEFIYWSDILEYGMVNNKGGGSSEKTILLWTISSGKININLSGLNISQLQFIEILQHHRNVFDPNN